MNDSRSRRRSPLRAVLEPVVAPATWRAMIHLCLNPLVSAFGLSIIATLVGLTLGFAVLVIPAVVLALLTLTVSRAFARVERARVRTLLDVDIPDPHRLPSGRTDRPTGGIWARLKARWRNPASWREVLYWFVQPITGGLGYGFSVAAWTGGLILAALPLYIDVLPYDTARFLIADVHSATSQAVTCGLGVVVLLAAPWITRGFALVDAGVASGLLGPAARNALAERVDTLEASRARTVDAAEAERRRIERDLHDGAQQRLVALAMDLGMAREKLERDPEGARVLVEEAHAEAKRALVELRDLARGIHPAVLTDRGLDAALSALAARSSVPVAVRVDVAPRPSPAVEAIAYFVVAEALTNVTRHADANRAAVTVARQGDRLVVEVTDDGRGGADAARGTGLAGLADRVAAVDGRLHVLSPAGGPTTVLAEIPCADRLAPAPDGEPR